MLRFRLIQAGLFFSVFVVGCQKDPYPRPEHALSMVLTMQQFDVADPASLALANAYMIRYAGRLDTLAQDSAWSGYLDFLDRFADAHQGNLRQPGGETINPFEDDGLLMRTHAAGVALETDPHWQLDRFGERLRPSLVQFIRLQTFAQDPTDARATFSHLHRLEWWADLYPASPLLDRIRAGHRLTVGLVADNLGDSLQNGASVRELAWLYDAMQAFPGLDANRVFCKLLNLLDPAQSVPSFHELFSAYTDTLQYRPRAAADPTE